MKVFIDSTVVSRCGECRHVDCEDDDGEIGLTYLCTMDAAIDCYSLYQENKDGLTPSCPMYPASVEVEG